MRRLSNEERRTNNEEGNVENMQSFLAMLTTRNVRVFDAGEKKKKKGKVKNECRKCGGCKTYSHVPH